METGKSAFVRRKVKVDRTRVEGVDVDLSGSEGSASGFALGGMWGWGRAFASCVLGGLRGSWV